MGQRFDNILATIGRTPAVRINKLAPAHVNLFVKIEAFNPMGSVKDRLALGVIEDAERSGALKPGQTVVEATSGNTGIGLAMVCAQKGYPLVVTMAENFSVERRKMMRFLGARVVLTPASEKGSGMLNKAEELAEAHGWFLARQFENEANADIHSRTTAVEILEDFEDLPLDYWVTGCGTGGTLKGVARVLRERSPATRVVVCEPDNAPVLASGVDQGEGSHPYFRPHLMQGWTPDFIPKLTGDARQSEYIDRFMPIEGTRALDCSKALAREEGIFVGITAGATFAGALALAEESPEGATILCMLPDTGERYLTTPLFEEIGEDMSAEEMELSRSTPSCRFDVSAPPDDREESGEDVDSPPGEVPAEGRAFVDEALNDTEQPVVMFALEWCEFCWAVRKLFAECGIRYRSVDLDSAAYQEGELGLKIRSALTAHTGIPTIPQIFVAGELVGGCTETFDAFNDGTLQKRLADAGVSHGADRQLDAYSFLPKWLHAR